MAVAGAIAPFAQFAMSADELSTHSTPVVSEAMSLLAEEHPQLMSSIKPLVMPLTRTASSAAECIPGEYFNPTGSGESAGASGVSANGMGSAGAYAGSVSAAHGSGACTECKAGFADHDSNPATMCKRCSQTPERFDIAGFAGDCTQVHLVVPPPPPPC